MIFFILMTAKKADYDANISIIKVIEVKDNTLLLLILDISSCSKV